MLAMTKASDSTRIWKEWRKDTKEDGTYKWWQITAGIWNVMCLIQNIQEDLENANFYHIKDNILDIQDEQWPIITYLKLVPI